MSHTLDEQGSPQRWIFIILIIGLVAISALYLVSRIFRYSGPTLLNSPYSVEKRQWLVSIASHQFRVPENVIRNASQRKSQAVEQLDLIMLWPKMEGYSLENQVHFSDMSADSSLIFVSLSVPQKLVASSERLYSIYSQYFSGDPIRGPSGLIGFKMAETSGFAGEILYFKPDSENPFVARCVTPDRKTPTFCMRDFIMDTNLQVSYRVRMDMLKYWNKLDDAIAFKVKTLIIQ